MLALKSVNQSYSPTTEILCLLESFRRMVNDCVEIGLSYNVTTLKRLSILSWERRRGYNCPTYYKASALSRAVGILSARKKSLRRDIRSRNPYSIRPQITAYLGFRVKDGCLQIPVGGRRFEHVPLTKRTLSLLSDPALRVRSFTLTSTKLSLCISKEIPEVECVGAVGVDRNLRNLTVGDEHQVVHYDLSDAVRIARTTMRIVSSFKRNDSRIRKLISSKYGQRRRNRTQHLLHNATKRIVAEALRKRKAIVLENIEGIRRLYRKGNGQGRKFRSRLNVWSFGEAQRQIEYKARWAGIPVIHLSRKETQGTSVTCPRCGERLQEDKRLRRKLWCSGCRVMMDRDAVAAINLSRRGRLRFYRSQAEHGPQGGAAEAVKGNVDNGQPLLPRVDASKSRNRRSTDDLAEPGTPLA